MKGLDTLHVKILAGLLRSMFKGCRIDRASGDKSRFVLYLSCDGGNGGSINFYSNRDVSLLWPERGFPIVPASHWNPPVAGCQVNDIVAVDNERIIEICLDTGTLIVELTGRRANIVYAEQGTVVTALKVVDDSMSRRQIRKGLPYSLPPRMKRTCPSIASADQLEDWIKHPEVAVQESTVSDMQYWQAIPEMVETTAAELFREITEGRLGFTIFNDRLYPFRMDGGQVFDSALDAFSNFIPSGTISLDLTPILKKIEQCDRKIQSLKKELQNWPDTEILQHRADTLATNQFRIKKGMNIIALPNVYVPDSLLSIDLKPDKSPAENVQLTYTYLKKAEKARTEIPKRMEIILAEKHRLEDLLSNPEQAVIAIKSGQKSRGSTHMAGSNKFYRRFSYKGYEILVGRNAVGNDHLTLKVAKSWDIWLHARNVSGSHTLIRLPDKADPPREVLRVAASIAAFYSNLKHQSDADIIWTYRKWVQNVRKRTGAVKLIKDYNIVVKPIAETQLNELRA